MARFTMINSILVPVDRSPAAEAGLNWARNAARRSRAAVRILSVVDADAPERTENAAVAEAYVQEQSQQISDAGVVVRHEVATGPPADVILARADDSELTVLTHREGRWDFGGCLATVLNEMRRPVLVVRSGAAEPQDGLSHPTILVPLDQPSFSRCVLSSVDMLANALNFRVVLCRAIKPFGPYMDPSQAPPGIASAIQDQIDAATCDLERDARELTGAAKPEIAVCMGDPSHEIARAAGHFDAGVIAMATRGGANLSRVMGSTAHAVLQVTRVPCLLVRPQEAPASRDSEASATRV